MEDVRIMVRLADASRGVSFCRYDEIQMSVEDVK